MLLLFIAAGKIAELMLATLLGKLVRRSNSNIDDDIVAALKRPVYVTFTLFGLGTATHLLDLPELPTSITLAILRTVAIVVWYGFLKAASGIVLHAISNSGHASRAFSSMLPLIETVTRVVLLALAVYFIFLAWSIDVTAWLASAGIIGLALSFAAKDTL